MFFRSWCRFKSRRIGNYVKIVNCTRNCTTVNPQKGSMASCLCFCRSFQVTALFSLQGKTAGRPVTAFSRYSQETCQLFFALQDRTTGYSRGKAVPLLHCFPFDLFARYFCWIRQNFPKHQGFIPGFTFLFVSAKSGCKNNHQHCFNAVTHRL